MARTKAAPAWRRVFLRALARTGNVRAAAEAAGVDKGTAYNLKLRDGVFAARWERALAKARNKPSPQPRSRLPDGIRSASGRGGNELVIRRSKSRGVQLVKAGAGRWSGTAEAVFLTALRDTGCVRRAAAICGFSTTALYNRRDAYPDFGERWDAAELEAVGRIDGFLTHSTIATFDPAAAGDADLPKVTIDQAIAIRKMKGGKLESGPAGRRGGRAQRRLPTREETDASILKKLEVVRLRMKARGWTETEDGTLVPPGWVRGDGAGPVDPDRQS